ncbi:MAG: single-stranded DNA-binding protein [Methanobacterium sp.]
MDLNNFTFTGRLVKDAVRKDLSNGSVVKFSVAVKSGFKDEDPVDYFDCNYWKCPTDLLEHLTKGKQVCIGGNLRQEKWEKDGVSYSKYVVKVSFLKLL